MSLEKRIEFLEELIGKKYKQPKKVIKGGRCERCKQYSYNLTYNVRCGPNASDDMDLCKECL